MARNCGVLCTGAGQIADRDRLFGGAAGIGAIDHLSELGRSAVGPEPLHKRSFQFAGHFALAGTVSDVEIRCRQGLGVNLALAGLVRSHCGDVQARVQPFSLDQRRA